MNAIRRNDVVRKRIADDASLGVEPRRQRIVDRNQIAVAIAVGAEIADARRLGRHGIDGRDAATLADAGVISKEERSAVAIVESGDDQRAAECPAELMPIE